MSNGKSSHWSNIQNPVVRASQQVTGQKGAPYEHILDLLFGIREFDSMADFGCGLSLWLHKARSLGATRIHGFDIPEIPLEKRKLKPEEFTEADLTKPRTFEERFDLAMSVEVAEHLPYEAASTFVETLTNASDWVMFGAAVPYQGGMGHINENWIEYWAKLFSDKGYRCYDVFRPSLWHDTTVTYFYRQNTMLYVKEGCDDVLIEQGYKHVERPATYIHPELFINAVNRLRPPSEKRFFADVKVYYDYSFDIEAPLPTKPDVLYGKGRLHTHQELGTANAKAIQVSSAAPGVSTFPPDLVNFLCIGAQKAGTSWLYMQLTRNQEVWIPPFKELHYFDHLYCEENRKWTFWHILTNVQRLIQNEMKKPVGKIKWDYIDYLTAAANKDSAFTEEWYQALFALAPKNRTVGEVTPEYSTIGPAGIAHIKRMMPNVKLIYLIRDPIERAWSQIRMNAQRQNLLEDEGSDLTANLLGLASKSEIINRGNYERYIPDWDAAFGSTDQILYLPYGQIATDPTTLMNSVESHLGISAGDYNKIEDRVHVSESLELPTEVESYLKAHLSSQYTFLEDRFGAEFCKALK